MLPFRPRAPLPPPCRDPWLNEVLWQEFRRRFWDTEDPVLTTDSADMQKGPQVACLTVGDALTRIGIDIALQSVPGFRLIRSHPFDYERHLKTVFGLDTASQP